MSGTFLNGISFIRSDNIPTPPEVGFIRIYVTADGTVWALDYLGISVRVTNV